MTRTFLCGVILGLLVAALVVRPHPQIPLLGVIAIMCGVGVLAIEYRKGGAP